VKEIVFGAVIAIACAVIAIFICIELGDQLVRHVSPVHHTNQNQTANNTPADTQVMISRRSSSDISRGPMLQSSQRATDRGLDFVIRNTVGPTETVFKNVHSPAPQQTAPHLWQFDFALHLSRTNLFETSDPRFRSGQTRERIPSNAWARKIAAPTKPITAVISNVATFLYVTARQKTAATLHSQKDFRAPTHNPDRTGIMRNRRASFCDPAPRIWEFAPKNLAWRKKPKHWRTITRPAIRFFLKVNCDPWLGLRLLRIVCCPGYPAHQLDRGRSLFAGKNSVSETPDPPPRRKNFREKQAPTCAGSSREARCIL
jgi:hypothetical protein